MTKLEFLKGMKKISSFYLKDMNEEQLKAWYSIFQDKNYVSFDKTIDEIVREQKIFPNVSELLKKYDDIERNNKCEILVLMKNDGYFKKGDFGELSCEQEIRNYEKAQSWIERGVIPSWLKEDMEKYIAKNIQISSLNTKLLNN